MSDIIKKDCSFEDMVFSHGLKHCEAGMCKVCSDGKWEEPEEPYPPRRGLTIAPGEDLSDI